jgi:hypothetical protein
MGTTDASVTEVDIKRLPPTINLELYAGDGTAMKFTLKDPDGNPWPIDGVITSQIKAKRTDEAALASWLVDESQQSDGVILLSLTGEQTAALIPSGKTRFVGVWDLQYVASGSEPQTLLQGKVTCDADVTR